MFQRTVFALMIALSWSSSVAEDDWSVYKIKFNKIYTGDEDLHRRAIWQDKIIQIKKHNELYAQGKMGFSLRENMFTDMSFKEISGTLEDNTESVDGVETPFSDMLVSQANNVPDRVNWTEKGVVTKVKNQGEFGSCWAFAVVAAVESHHIKSTGKVVSLSESNLIDCATIQGCNITSRAKAFQYIIDNKGIATASSYPYVPEKESCKFSSNMTGAQIKSYVQLPVAGDENALKIAVATKGPISVGIDVSNPLFYDYSKGLYDNSTCSTTGLTHAVLLVGYGTENGKDYWILKNSWGETWGDCGYMKMARNKNNICGIATRAIYPIVTGISGQESLSSNVYPCLDYPMYSK